MLTIKDVMIGLLAGVIVVALAIAVFQLTGHPHGAQLVGNIGGPVVFVGALAIAINVQRQ